MKEFLQTQIRFSSLKSIQPEDAESLYEKTISDAKRRFYNYAKLTGQEEKIREKINKIKDN
ncbi:pyruvate ferredoxin/flavodoxin oxidoreductase family protein [Melissococcus plutonius ATCC 35311]|uniref:Pyruvate ferredoxin/flavodoxin oxidoreductase family protein n=2 Tax=Melissococcus plutonius TaxID=33970 RepID=F3Y9X0_MELPT|nr:pyruvate ferredoxin/flavodoxin oxidoreductase family protein [Melissococcus plutonius ATCC 35311]